MNSRQNYPRRLIEVDLPIKRISAHARREKSIRHGHISTLHIWWARRPLAACRAVICAALWLDPVDPQCPPAFFKMAREQMLLWAPHERQKLLSEESQKRFEKVRKNPDLFNDPTEVRAALLDFIADFANWDNSTVGEYLDTSRALTQSAHEALNGIPGARPLVVDPFAGGGAIPLEALRLGADAYASDLNPVATLLNKVVLEYIPKYGSRLADEVRKWGEWVKLEAEKELAEYYPRDADGATPIAYLWARTIQCEGPACGAEVPLTRSLWLAKKANRSVAMQLVPNARAKRVDIQIINKLPSGWVNQANESIKVENSKFEGTIKRGSATCPCCGYTTPVTRVREQLKARHGGTNDARLMAVVTTRRNEQGRFYRLSTERDLEVIQRSRRELERRKQANSGDLSPVPTEKFSGQEPRRIPVPQYGMNSFGDLFSDRQLLSMTTLCRLSSELALQRAEDSGLMAATRTLLALAIDKQADLANALCAWEPIAECPRHLFGKQAISMVWDFAEGVVTGQSSGAWRVQIDRMAHILETIGSDWASGQVENASAMAQPLPNDVADALVTDPPYYYSVPYADLADFFYVWLRRQLRDIHPELFRTEVSPKQDECVQNLPHSAVAHLQKNRDYYEQSMVRALSESRRLVKQGAIGVVVFAHSSTDAWESLLGALISAGWAVTASWPLDTEMATRIVAQRQVTLASSVHLVCRPRENSDGSVRTDDTGDWRDVLHELPQRIHEWMPRLAEEGIVGADAIFACLGPALEVFSRYSRVEKASGETVSLKEFLEQVWAAVSKEALAMIFTGADATGFEEDARLTAMWLWTLSTDDSRDGDVEEEDAPNEDEEDEDAPAKGKVRGFVLEYDAARKIAQGLGAHLEQLESLVEVKGTTARLLPVAERTRSLFQTSAATELPDRGQAKKKGAQLSLGFVADLEEAEESGAWGSTGAPHKGETVLDRVHQSMILFGAGRGEALKRFLVDDGAGRDERFWRLAQAFSALYPSSTDEKRWVDGVLARKKSLGF
ncbi:putative DNA methylase [Bradyrhizobium diazoefficiens]